VTDEQGNAHGVGGARGSRHDYFPFGEEVGGVGGRETDHGYAPGSVRKKFTGYERDGETNLDFAQARYYNGAQGRFISVDPLMASGTAGNPQSWNRYSYTFNNPLNFVDPTGLRNDYYIERDGYIAFIETEDTFDRFYYQESTSWTLVATLEKNSAGLVKFPDSGTGFNRYGMVDAGGTDKDPKTRKVREEVGEGDHYLEPKVAAALFGVCMRLYKEHSITISLGDMSSSNGSDPWQSGQNHHSGHGHQGNRSGMDIDFRYLNGDGVSFQSASATTDSQFSSANNQTVFDTAVKFGFTVNYQGTAGSSPLTGPSRVSGHNDHGHLGFGDGSKVMVADRALARKLRGY
jgi:RHS repeat-associated protein